MALWTPYADNALDLSKSSKEAPSPEPVYPYHFGYNIPMPHISPSPVHMPHFSRTAAPMPHFSPLSATVPVPHLSPLSAASLSSYERPFSPQFSHERSITPYRVQTLSPPISPESQKRDWVDDSLSDDPDFQKFERDALQAMAKKNGGVLLGNNPRMRRTVCSNSGSKDDSYRKQRERNNFAAKQSRDRRKLREIHLALKVTYLKKEVAGLKALLASRVCNRCHESCRC